MDSDVIVSVIVCTYSREQVLCDTIDHLLRDTYPDKEILVIDQTPDHEPATDEYLRKVSDRIRLVHHSPPNLSAARNRGVREARGEIILYVDDDVIPDPGFVEKHARNYDDPSIGGVAGRILTVGESPKPTRDPRTKWPRLGVFFRDYNGSVREDCLCPQGCNMSFRKSVIEAVGGFDERFFGPNHDDTDMGCRVRKAGYRMVFDPEASLVHLAAPSGGCRPKRSIPAALNVAMHRGNCLFMRKHIPLYLRPFAWLYVFHGLVLGPASRRQGGYLRIGGFLGAAWRGYRDFRRDWRHGTSAPGNSRP